MRLLELVSRALGPDVAGLDSLPDSEVRGVAQDSRRVAPGFVFVARPGLEVDGHTFVPEALVRGAVAVVGEAGPEARASFAWAGTAPYIRVGDAKSAVAKLAASFFGYPSQKLEVVGVTGTDGKTTTATLLHWLLSSAGPCGLISTAGCKIGQEPLTLPGHFTTPEAPEVQELLARSLAAGCSWAVLESSSHGFAQKRLDEVAYALGIVTNLSPEHLDYHGTLEAYRDAKAELMRRAPFSVLNADDPSFEFFAAQAGEVISYAADGADAAWRALDVTEGAGGLSWQLVAETARGGLDLPVFLPMIGSYNVHNALAALAAAHALGLDASALAARLATFPGVPGRMQLIQKAPFKVVVDFAHTAPALHKALMVLRPRAGRLIVVVGAAGERDPAKRAPLGAAAARSADYAIFTEEDHRSEDLSAILETMAAGARAAGGVEGKTFVTVPDRREAIARAVQAARPGDVVLLAGKGHERTLERTQETLSWDEAAEARRALGLS